MSKYKNISDKDLSIPGIGIVKAGEEREMPEGFNNANFKKVASNEEVKKENKQIKTKE